MHVECAHLLNYLVSILALQELVYTYASLELPGTPSNVHGIKVKLHALHGVRLSDVLDSTEVGPCVQYIARVGAAGS